MSRHTKILFGLLILLIFLVFPDAVFAQGSKPMDFVGESARGQLGLSVHDILLKLGAVNTFFHIMILITLNFVEYLLQADFFMNPNMMSALNSIWRLSRDIMNVFFAIALIGTAIYTIITAKKDFVMSKISTFVIAVILVNFSWFIPRVIMDVANILTATIYTIPLAIGGYKCEAFGPDGTPIPCKLMVDVDLFGDEQQQAAFCRQAARPEDCPCQKGLGCYLLKDFDAVVNQGDVPPRHVMINGLVVNFVKILALTRVPDTVAGPGPISARDGFFINLRILMSIMTVVLIQLATLLPLIGLVVGLFIRIIVIWVTVAFMPFVFLGYLKDGKIGTAVFGFEIDIWKEFLNAAFLPALVALPITIGFIMLTTVVTVPSPADLPMTMNIPLIFGVKTWWAMLWMIAAIGILWKGAFTALSKSKLIGTFTDKIKGFGEYIGSAALQLPLITPLPFPGKMNLGTLVHGPKIFADTIRLKATGTRNESFGELLGNALGRGGAKSNPTNPVEVNRISDNLAREENRANASRISESINRLKDIHKDVSIINEIREKIELPAGSSPEDVLRRLEAIANTHKVPDITKHLEKIRKLLTHGNSDGPAPAPVAPPGPPPAGGAAPGGA